MGFVKVGPVTTSKLSTGDIHRFLLEHDIIPDGPFRKIALVLDYEQFDESATVFCEMAAGYMDV